MAKISRQCFYHLPLWLRNGFTSMQTWWEGLRTSSSGSGDLLKSLGVDLSHVNEVTTPEIVKNQSFVSYLHLPFTRMGLVAHIRSQFVPTIFNILGPLINPIPLRARVLGCTAKSWVNLMRTQHRSWRKSNT